MWQQRASYEQSNMLDVRIQCQFNIAASHMAEFSTMFGSPTPNSQTQGQQTNECQPFYNNTCDVPPPYRSQCEFDAYRHTPPYCRQYRAAPNQTNVLPTASPELISAGSPLASHHPSAGKLDYYHGHGNQFLDDSGFGSPSINQPRQLPVAASSSPAAFTTAADNCLSKSRVGTDTSADHWLYSSCNYGYNQRQNQPEMPTSPPIKDTDDHCEEMKVAMREKDVTHRLFALRERDPDVGDEIEKYYQSQTALIDIERHNILCQMAYDSESTVSINKYYNRKLITLLDSVELKLATCESANTTKTTRKCADINPKKSRLLPKHAVKILESWYQENLENPYPSRDVTLSMASEGGISVEQIRKWFANKRNRSRNSKLKKGLLDE